MTGTSRIIIHVDMDQFFAAVEELEYPEIIGKPVIVGADPREGKGRGVVSTCNYEARKYGVESGMAITRAWKLCHQAVFLPVNHKLYSQVSARIMDILRQFAVRFEPWGFDEAFLDVSSRVKDYEKARELAHEIKQEIFEKEKLTCSIGVGPNKLVAKIASDFKKPDGLTIVEEKDVKAFLDPLDVNKLLWVGKKTTRKLNKLGIKTIGDIVSYDPSILMEKFGILGRQLYLYAQGLDRSEVGLHRAVKSISRNVTFERDTQDSTLVFQALDKLCREIYEEAKNNDFLFKTVTITVRYEDFETHTSSKTLTFFINELSALEKAAHELMQPYLRSDKKIRLVAVRVSKIVSVEKQKKLFS